MNRADARVLVVGAGGLGCPVAIALARAGVGLLGLADDDDVELSNLHRQLLYGERDVGRPKAARAAASLAELAPAVKLVVHETRMLPENARSLANEYDLVVEGSDNFATKFLAADACMLQGVPIVQGAAVRWHGTALSSGPAGRPCYRCVFEDIPAGAQAGCNEAGVMGPVVGVVGALMADLALRVVDGGATGALVTYDGRTGVLRERSVGRRAGCPLCGDVKSITSISDSRYRAPACATGG